MSYNFGEGRMRVIGLGGGIKGGRSFAFYGNVGLILNFIYLGVRMFIDLFIFRIYVKVGNRIY